MGKAADVLSGGQEKSSSSQDWVPFCKGLIVKPYSHVNHQKELCILKITLGSYQTLYIH